MTNGKVQTKTSNPKVSPPTVRTGHVKMGIVRTIQTEKYQSLVMHCHIEEEIEWSTLDDWFQKQQNWESILIRRYKEMHDNILKELNFSEKRAYFNDGLENKVNTEKGLAELDELDDLEALE